jgi:hypothetical protein
MSKREGSQLPGPAEDLLAATPETAYFWGRVAGDGELTAESVTVRAADEQAADALASIAGADEIDHSVSAHTSTHDASIVRFEDEYELQVFGAPAERASAALGLPLDDEPGGYRFDAFSDHWNSLLRGILEACGTICFRESSGSVGISFVHDDEQFLETVRSLLADSEPSVPTDDLSESSSGGYWFGLGDDAAVDRFAEWLYADSDETGLFSAERRQKLARSVERATDREVGSLS